MLVSVIPVAARTVQNAVVSILFHMSKSKVKSLQACTQTWKLGVGGGGGGGGGLIIYMGMCHWEGYDFQAF